MTKIIKKLSSLCVLSILCALCVSCDEWLDVRGENIEKEQDQFETYKGFRDALTGCYMKMGAAGCLQEYLCQRVHCHYNGECDSEEHRGERQ